jgi:3-oxoacyl-[acyl-carrier protein] reductase
MRDGNTAYSAMKEGVIGFSKNLARELQPYSIRVNVVAPGLIRLPMENETVELPKADLQRRGQPEDVAYAALYFASDESRWVTGQVLSVDGGADVFVNHERVSD